MEKGYLIRFNPNLSPSTEVTAPEAVAIRAMFKDGMTEPELAVEFGVSEQCILKVLNGRVWPYAGGPLRPPPLTGPVISDGMPKEKIRFVKGVLNVAVSFLHPVSLQVLSDNLGFGLEELMSLAEEGGENEPRKVAKFLRLQAEERETKRARAGSTG